jgi:hypothetical protein
MVGHVGIGSATLLEICGLSGGNRSVVGKRVTAAQENR